MTADEIRANLSVLAPTAKVEDSEALCAIAVEIAAQLAELNENVRNAFDNGSGLLEKMQQ